MRKEDLYKSESSFVYIRDDGMHQKNKGESADWLFSAQKLKLLFREYYLKYEDQDNKPDKYYKIF